MANFTLDGIDEVKAHVGQDLGVSDWREVTQQDVDTFADLCGDHQWIHVDVERAKQSRFGGTIVHGYLTLALLSGFRHELFEIKGFAQSLNYGLDRVRFPAPLPVGSRVRMRATLASVEEVEGGIQVKIACTFEREGGKKPVCVAEKISRLLTA